MFDGEAFGREIVIAVRSYLSREMAPLLTQLAELEARMAALDGQKSKEAAIGREGAGNG
jgi:hypothetical protein